MKKQLLLCKRLFSEGAVLAERQDPVSCGMAISLFQDSVEMLVWTLIKDRGIAVKDEVTFTSNLKLVRNHNIALLHTPKLLELNKARVNFKHYGILPAIEEATNFQAYVEDLLRSTFADHFGQSYEDLSLVDLVSLPDVRERLKSAEAVIASGKYAEAMSEAGIAKALLFRRLERFVPNVDRHLREMDSKIGRVSELRGMRTFEYLTLYLELLRETTLASLLRLPLKNYYFVRLQLPSAVQFGDGKWETQTTFGAKYDEAHCRRAVSCLIDACVRLESIL